MKQRCQLYPTEHGVAGHALPFIAEINTLLKRIKISVDNERGENNFDSEFNKLRN